MRIHSSINKPLPKPAAILPPSQRPLGKVLSMEEAEIMLDEARNCAASAESDLGETERILEISESLEDLALIADGVDEASATELRLIETAGDMAVAGTDVSPEAVVPSMESYQGKKIATEGFKETAKTLWLSIQKFLKQIWGHIQKFFRNIVESIPTQRHAIRNLKTKLEALPHNTIPFTNAITMKAGGKILVLHGKQIDTVAKLEDAINPVLEAANSVFKDYTTDTINKGKAIAEAMQGTDLPRLEKALSELVQTIATKPSWTPPGATRSNDEKNILVVFKGTTLLGDRALSMNFPALNRDYSAREILDHFRNYRVEFISTTKDDESHTPEASFNVPKVAELLTLLKQLERVLDAVETNRNDSAMHDLLNVQKDIEQKSIALQKLTDEKASENYNDPVPHHRVLGHYRTMVNFNLAYARWIESPSVAFTTYLFTIVKSAINIVNLSLHAYSAEK